MVAEFAMAVVLLTGAGLMIRSLAFLRGVNPGFQPERLLTMRIVPPRSKFAEARAGRGVPSADSRPRSVSSRCAGCG